MDGFVEPIYIQSIRVLWVSEILLSGLNLFSPFSEGLSNFCNSSLKGVDIYRAEREASEILERRFIYSFYIGPTTIRGMSKGVFLLLLDSNHRFQGER